MNKKSVEYELVRGVEFMDLKDFRHKINRGVRTLTSQGCEHDTLTIDLDMDDIPYSNEQTLVIKLVGYK